jgi:hypothetical protein
MSHQINESVFRGALQEDIELKAFPAFPPSARLPREQRPTSDQGAHRWDAWRKAGLSRPFQQRRS